MNTNYSAIIPQGLVVTFCLALAINVNFYQGYKTKATENNKTRFISFLVDPTIKLIKRVCALLSSVHFKKVNSRFFKYMAYNK